MPTYTPPCYTLSPKRLGYTLPLKEYWQYRDLLYFFVWKELRVRYAQSILGLGWALVQPVSSAILFVLVLGRWGGFSPGVADNVPYPLFTYLGTVAWTYCSNAISEGANSLAGNSNMVSKIYFPKIFLPLSGHIAKLLDLALAGILVLPLMAYYGLWQSARWLWLPLGVGHLVCMTLALSLWCSALGVQYRDVRYGLNFALQLLFYLSPVVYSSQLIPPKYHFLQGLNPLVSALEGLRYAVIPGYSVDPSAMLASALTGWLLLLGGLLYFEYMQAQFADLI